MLWPIRARFDSKPEADPVDWAHPLAKGLRSLWLFNERGGSVVHDALNRSVSLTLTTKYSFTVDPQMGPGLLAGALTNPDKMDSQVSEPYWDATPPMTLLVRCRPQIANNSEGALLEINDAGSNRRVSIYGKNKAFDSWIGFVSDGTATASIDEGSAGRTWDGTVIYSVALVSSAANSHRLFVDGKPTTAANTTSINYGTFVADQMSLFHQAAQWDGTVIDYVAFWQGRALTAKELVSLAHDPDQFLRGYNLGFMVEPQAAAAGVDLPRALFRRINHTRRTMRN